jgi:UDP-glucose 4-epimerase
MSSCSTTSQPDAKRILKDVAGHPRLTYRAGSITDPVLLAEVVPGVDVIYHMAAAVGVKLVADDPVRTIETNIYPTEMLLRLAVQGGQRFFLASTSEVYGKNAIDRWTEEDDLQLGRRRAPAGRTAARRRSTSSWPWRTTASTI